MSWQGRLARSAVALAVAACLAPLAGTPLAASANEGCVQNTDGSWSCRYTQLDNGNFPGNSSDPDCHQYCAWYQRVSGKSPEYYPYLDLVTVMNVPGVDFHGWMRSAVQAWSGLPYNSPFFYNCNCSNGQQFLTLGNLQFNYPGTTQTDTTDCGVGNATTAWQAYGSTNDNHVVSAYADYNDQFSGEWVDDQFRADGNYQCSAAQTAYHELGHAFGEGHATADLSEIMYSSNGHSGDATDKVDGDAQQLLDLLYGAYDNSDNNGGSGGCNNCQMACPQIQTGLAADGIQTVNAALWTTCGTGYGLPYAWGYYAKLWDMAQGAAQVPGVPSPPTAADLTRVVEETAPLCWDDFTSRQLTAWLQCVTK